MIQDAESSSDSDVEEGSLFMGRRRKGQRSSAESAAADTPTSSYLFPSVLPPAKRTVSLDEEEEREDSLHSPLRRRSSTFGSSPTLTLTPKESPRKGAGSQGTSLQASPKVSKTPQGSPRRSTQQGTPQGSPQKRSQSAERARSAEYDYVMVSPGDSKRASAALDDWTLISQSPDVSDNEMEATPEVDEDLEHKKLYLLVARCIAHPFNAKYQIETTPPRSKMNGERFKFVCNHLKAVVNGKREQVTWPWEAKLTHQELEVLHSHSFLTCVFTMLEEGFKRSEVMDMCDRGGFSMREVESIFKVRASYVLSCDSATHASEVGIWCSTFKKVIEQCSSCREQHHQHHGSSGPAPSASSAAVLNQDKLYKVFQEVLKIRSIEHQVLYRELQLGNPEEQEAVVRKELQARKKVLQDPSRPLLEGKFGSRRVEEIYREEQLKMLRVLNSNLDQLSLQGTNIGTTDKKKKRAAGVSESGGTPVLKHNLHFNLKVKVTIHELTELHPAYDGKSIFCVFTVLDSGRDPYQTQSGEAEDSTLRFGEEGEFWMSTPMPQVKLELRANTKSMFSDSKLLAKHTHTAVPSSSDVYSNISLHHNEKKENEPQLAKLRISTIVERPTSIKKCGYLVTVGSSMFKQRKKRFFTLNQLSQYKFLLCWYQPNGTQPKETLQLDQGLTVEYTSDESQLKQEPDAKYLFDLVFEDSELGLIHFGCRDDAERQSWIEWMVRGTGQSTPPQNLGVTEVVRTGCTDLERYGLKEAVVSVNDISSLEPHRLFMKLFRACLEYRLNEDLFTRGLFSPAQMYVLDEFCARYGVRDPFRHLTCLQEWLDCVDRGVSIWPVMIQSSFCFCQMHIGGMNPPEKSVIVTAEEREVFVEVCQRIEEVVSHHLLNFRTCFPFCCPKGDLRTTLKLFDLVTSISHSSQVANATSPLKVLTHIMEKGALVTYKQIYERLNVEGDEPLPLATVFKLAHLCITFMYELHNFFWEEFNPSQVFAAHINAFWSFFLVDMREGIGHSNDTMVKLQLFRVVNNYFSSQATMRKEDFHQEFLNAFTPVVVQHIEVLEETLRQALSLSLAKETWLPMTLKCCGAVEDVMKTLLFFKQFLRELNWPEGSFAAFLEQKVAAIAADRFQEAAEVIRVQFGQLMLSGKGSTPLSYSLPPEFFTMINTLVYLRSQVAEVCASQRVQVQSDLNNESTLEHDSTQNLEEHLSSILNDIITMAVSKLCNPLQDILTKLVKFDPSEGFFASLKMMIPTNIPTSAYTEFLTSNIALLTENLVSTIYRNFIVNWYECQMQLLNQWLDKRPDFSLHKTQLTATQQLFKTLWESFVACEVPPQQLRSQSHDSVEDRIRVENSNIDLLSIGKD